MQELRSTDLHQGISATFLERRFRSDDSFDAQRMARLRKLAFPASAAHIDEFYRISERSADLDAGLYRIRRDGSGTVVLTLKHDGGRSNIPSETIEHINPSEELLSAVRKKGCWQP